MSIVPLNIGSSANDGTGQDLRSGGKIINDNFVELDQRTATAQATADGKVDKQAGKGLSTEDFTTGEKNKLAGLQPAHYRGTFTTLAALQSGVVTPIAGDYGDVDAGVGSDVQRYIWDASDSKWVLQGASGGGPDNTDSLPEGSTNRYFTAERVLGVALSGLSLLAGTAVVATDSVLVAFGKLQKQITDLSAAVANKAAKGANSDITALSGLTTALSVTQGGTGGKTPADARSGLELKTAALADVTTSNTDANADRVLRPGNFGIGSYDPIIVPDANAIRMAGFYYGAGSGNTPETYGFIQHQGAGAQDGLQRFVSAVTRIEYKRILSSGVWGAWESGAVASPITKSFTTAQQNFVGAGQFVVSHGMGVKPRIIQAWFVCVVAEAGYSVGDSMPYPEFGTDSGGSTGLSCVSTNTTVTVRMGASQFVVLQKASGSAIFVTAANWRIYLELFA